MAGGYGWITAYRSRHIRPEDSQEDAETILRAALADDRAQARTESAEPRPLQPETALLTAAAARQKAAGAGPGPARTITVGWTEVRSDADDELIGWEFGLLPLHEDTSPRPGWITRHGILSTDVRSPHLHTRRLRELTEQAPAQHELIEMAYAHALAKAMAIPV